MKTLDRLTKLSAQKSSRLESLRSAAIPVATLVAECRQPEANRVGGEYLIFQRHQKSNVGRGDCTWLTVRDRRPYDGKGPAYNGEWTLARTVGHTGGFTNGDFNCPMPAGPSRRQLREFCEWLVMPDNLTAILNEEERVSKKETDLTMNLKAAAVALGNK